MDQIKWALEQLEIEDQHNRELTPVKTQILISWILEAVSELEDRIRNLEMLEEHSRPRNR